MGRKRADFPAHFFANIGKPLQKSISLRDYSNFKIGGKADYFFDASSVIELVVSVSLAREYSFPYYIIGGGYNLLFDDGGFRGIIIKNSVKGVRRQERKTEIQTFAGTSLSHLIQFTIKEGLSGLEFLAGIPGTIGGAIFGNAGAFKQSTGDYLKEAELLDREGEQITVKRDYFKFSYRQSILKKKHDVLLSATFKLINGEKEKIKARIEENLEKREKKHPPQDIACAGSYFKNLVLPDGKIAPAATFLEKVGAKHLTKGGASVYPGHSNFIITQEGASARDVIDLAQELKERVKERFNIELEEEVIFLPADSSLL